jgi:hypothetical protein
MKRKFYPTDDTRYFDWPNYDYAYPWRLDLKDNELAAQPPVQVLAGTTVIPNNQIFFGPWRNEPGPPWTFFELDRSSTAAFGGNASTPQRAIVVQGTFGYDVNKDQMATLVNTITSGATTLVVTDSSQLGPGIVIILDTERMLVTDSAQVATGLTLASTGVTTAIASDNTLAAPGGAGTLQLFETILIDSERMLVVDTTSTGGYVVKRGWDGTVLATHVAGTAIGAYRQLSVQRGALGTTAASHSSNAPVYRHRVPSMIRDLSIAQSEVQLTGEPSAWAIQGDVPTGMTSSATARNLDAEGLPGLRVRAQQRYRRNVRLLAI